MELDAVFFDLDDTLFDHRFARRAALRVLQREEPALARLPLLEMDRAFERILTEVHLRLVLTGRISVDSSRLLRMRRFLREYRIELPAARVRELTAQRVDAYQRHRRAVPGAPALLRRLRTLGVPVAVVTNNLVSEQTAKLAATGLAPYVGELVCSEEVGVTKPHPRIFRAALRRTGARAAHTVMVGDSWDSDVRGAAALGIWPVWLNRERQARPAKPLAGELRGFVPLSTALDRVLGGPPRDGSSRRGAGPTTRLTKVH